MAKLKVLRRKMAECDQQKARIEVHTDSAENLIRVLGLLVQSSPPQPGDRENMFVVSVGSTDDPGPEPWVASLDYWFAGDQELLLRRAFLEELQARSPVAAAAIPSPGA
jgi:hypothetical protein